ncbi:cytochrome P450 [Bradyrhizobium sp. BR13661]|jgi:cytochrome P450|uniref:cytochrome P450 n=1 Tax=Bradyrhizobium sp. BR13661 TaxID=2940622 RepID=UPI002473349C|nr:cytochrome P450 [Bradyrhizobium sp. BR13661]MDH6256886.1 cytochrome P450 [Bradyrhizobium sp. BR13661]
MSAPGSATSGVPHLDVDPFDMNFLADPYPAHELLRETGPVVYLDKWKLYGVARYAEVHAVLNDPATFCSSRGVGLSDFKKETPWRPPSLILEADPPEHSRTRAVLAKVLSPTVMKGLRDRFAAAAEERVELLIQKRSFDAIADLAEAYPLSIFPDALGLKPEGRDHLIPYASLVFNAFGPPNQLRQDAIARSAPHQAYVTDQCQRDNLTPGGIGACIHAHVDEGVITATEAPLLVRSLLSAGLDTTVNGIGAALYCLARFPDQWQRLRGDLTLARNAFEEAVRFESPVQTFFRTTTREVELSGAGIGEGEKVLMFLAAANRDPRRWDQPDSYDITRRTSGHVGYGSGIHMCVGQLVARLEGETMLSALARRIEKIEIAGEPKRRFNNTLRGLDSLPVAITPA